VGVQLIIAVEALSTEATLWVAFEAALVDGTGIVVAKLLVLAQLGLGEQLMLVRKDLFITRAEIAARPACQRISGLGLKSTTPTTLLSGGRS